MDPASVALSLVTTIDLCFKRGGALVDVCTAFKNAEAHIKERLLSIENHWKRTTIQLDVIKQIWSTLDEEHQAIQTRILQVLIRKINDIILKIEGLLRNKSDGWSTERKRIEIKRFKYVRIKKCLDESIEDLSSWQRQFDPSWFLMLKVSNPFIDQELSKKHSTISSLNNAHSLRDALRGGSFHKTSVFLPREGLNTVSMRVVPLTSLRCALRSGSDKWFLLDSFRCGPEVDISLATRDVRDLARKLSSVEPYTFSILKCRGVVRDLEHNSRVPHSFDFVFEIPQELGNEPKSLRSYLTTYTNIALTKRLELATQIAKSISYVHTLGFVHKNARPETIIGFQLRESKLGSFFLLGFQYFRTSEGRTLRSGDNDWEKNLYRHPQRQGLNPSDIYTMQHDIYSLGVCLLEIGLWESFVSYNEDETSPSPTPALGVTLASREFGQPVLMKDHLISLAKRNIPVRMGERYMDIVINCLTCLDEDNVDFGCQSEFEDADGVLVGVRYIEKIMLKLGEIVI